MFSEKVDKGRLPARSRIALVLLLCGLLLGAIWAVTLIGVALDILWIHWPWGMG